MNFGDIIGQDVDISVDHKVGRGDSIGVYIDVEPEDRIGDDEIVE